MAQLTVRKSFLKGVVYFLVMIGLAINVAQGIVWIGKGSDIPEHFYRKTLSVNIPGGQFGLSENSTCVGVVEECSDTGCNSRRGVLYYYARNWIPNKRIIEASYVEAVHDLMNQD